LVDLHRVIQQNAVFKIQCSFTSSNFCRVSLLHTAVRPSVGLSVILETTYNRAIFEFFSHYKHRTETTCNFLFSTWYILSLGNDAT